MIQGASRTEARTYGHGRARLLVLEEPQTRAAEPLRDFVLNPELAPARPTNAKEKKKKGKEKKKKKFGGIPIGNLIKFCTKSVVTRDVTKTGNG